LRFKAIKLALKEINEACILDGKKIRLLIENTQCSNPGGLVALQKCNENGRELPNGRPTVSFIHLTLPRDFSNTRDGD
jgi:hypothetical protein